MPFNMFPYSNFHNLNLDWILATLKAMVATIEQAQSTMSGYESRLEAAETGLAQITPAAQGAVRHDVSQALDAANRRRAAGNIHAVSFDTQLLSAAEQAQARTNIGAISSGDIPPAADAVLYTAQQLTEAQQDQARSNIAAASQSDMTTVQSDMTTVQSGLQRAVRWDVQQLTDVQKQQARTNIGAISSSDIPPAANDYVFTVSENELGTGYDVTGNLSDAAQVTGRVFIVLEQSGRTREALAELTYAGGTLSYVRAFFADFFTVDSSIPNTITQVIINSNGATVTDIQQQQVPHPAPLGADAGKVLVAGNNTCSWEQITPVVNTISGTTPTITPADNNIYNCGEVTSLTISSAPATGAYSIVFTSGATATTTTIPATIMGLETFAAEANTLYEINVLDNRAVVGRWGVTP